MIVPMKKVSLIISGERKKETLKKLRKLGILHVEITEGQGQRLGQIKEQIELLESTAYLVGKDKKQEQKKSRPSRSAFYGD